MPETAMHENGDPLRGEDQIRSRAENTNIQPVSETARMKRRTDDALWFRILRPDPLHQCATLGSAHDVGHRPARLEAATDTAPD